MELCKNLRSVRMGFIIRLKSTGEEVGDVSAIIPIDRMDDDYYWWKYGVLAYLHDRKKPTHMEERNRYTATAKLDFQTRHSLVEKALAEGYWKSQQDRLAKHQAKLAVGNTPKAKAPKAKKPKAKQMKPAKAKKPAVKREKAKTSDQLSFPFDSCQNCGYRDPLAGEASRCPNCGN